MKVCKKRHIKSEDFIVLKSLCDLLESHGILERNKRGGRDSRINLRIDEGEVEAALKDKAFLEGILKDTDCIVK